jgi:hypothetical protein
MSSRTKAFACLTGIHKITVSESRRVQMKAATLIAVFGCCVAVNAFAQNPPLLDPKSIAVSGPFHLLSLDENGYRYGNGVDLSSSAIVVSLPRFPSDAASKAWLADLPKAHIIRFGELNPALKRGDLVSGPIPSVRCLLERATARALSGDRSSYGFQCVSDESLTAGHSALTILFFVTPDSATGRYIETHMDVLYGQIE